MNVLLMRDGQPVNLVICCTTGNREFSVLMSDTLPDLHVTGAPSQCFPLWIYEPVRRVA